MLHKQSPVDCRRPRSLLMGQSIFRTSSDACRLSEYNHVVCMPHMHDERTGGFQPLADEVMQVESGLAVSFRRAADIAGQADRCLPV